MEGNDCYKFSTIYNFILRTGAKPISVAVDVGVHVGAVLTLMQRFFPDARIFGFEAVKEYFDVALTRTKDLSQVELFNQIVTAEHLYADDLGKQPRPTPCALKLLKALPSAGPGYQGGSKLLPIDHGWVREGGAEGFELHDCPLSALALNAIFDLVAQRTGELEIDLLKMDCEGCEHSVLGTATVEALQRVRFIVGEYHELDRFFAVMRGKLFKTHKVNLIGTQKLGAFFAERLDGTRDGILKFDNSGMLHQRPWLSGAALEWHIFNEEFVMPHELGIHALPSII